MFVVVVVVLFDSTLCDVFSFLDATRRVVVVVFVVLRRRRLRRRRRHTENTPYRGVTVRWARPLTASFYFYLLLRIRRCRRRRPVRLDAFDALSFS
jgi:hypothetical protein